MYRLAGRLPFLPILLIATLGATLSQASEYPKVTGFSAYLLNSQTGQLSRDVIEHNDALGNVPASNEFSSVSTLVVVHVNLGPENTKKGQVQLEVTGGGATFGLRRPISRKLLNHTSQMGPSAKDGTTHVGFWLDDTGCETLTLKATAIVGTKRASKEGTVGFACYE